MATLIDESMQQDQLAMSVARALTIANAAAHENGIERSASLITITEEMTPSGSQWRIHYGPREYLNRRGGDLIVLVDANGDSIRKVIRGQ